MTVGLSRAFIELSLTPHCCGVVDLFDNLATALAVFLPLVETAEAVPSPFRRKAPR
jgi:hypothetical protein